MTDAFFIAMWLIPFVAFVLILRRVAKTVSMIHKHVKDPEAFAAAVRNAIETSPQGEDFDPASVAAKILSAERGDPAGARFGSKNSLGSQRPTPIGESESSGGAVWLVIAVAVGIAVVAFQLQ